MSDPTELYFCVSVGFFTNHRKIALERLIGERANYVPQILWSYASLNQRNGDFSTYTAEDFKRIFQIAGLRTNLAVARKIITAVKEVGFLDKKGHLHSWKKFNKFFASFGPRHAARARWREQRRKEREAAQAAATQQNGNGNGLGRREPKPPPLFREIESLRAVINDKKEVLKKIKVPCQKWDEGRRDLIDPPERKAALDRRAPLVTEIAELEAKVKELHYRQARVRA